jgi:hypothetical protein
MTSYRHDNVHVFPYLLISENGRYSSLQWYIDEIYRMIINNIIESQNSIRYFGSPCNTWYILHVVLKMKKMKSIAFYFKAAHFTKTETN